MYKPFCLFILLTAFATAVSAQGFINGYLRDSITHFVIREGTIKNATTGQIIRTDEKGFFRLKAAPNDLIYVLATAHRYDTLQYSPLVPKVCDKPNGRWELHACMSTVCAC